MSRTNVVIDDRLIAKVMRQYGIRTKREVIDFALRRLVSPYARKDMLDLEGAGWGGDLDELRAARVRDEGPVRKVDQSA